MYKYKAKVIEVYDGDTITCEVDLGFFVKITEKIRLHLINTPEIRGEEREKGILARDYLRERILGKEIEIQTYKKGKYGRWVADIYFDGKNINEELVRKNHAVFKIYK